MKRFMMRCVVLAGLLMAAMPAVASAQKEVPGTFIDTVQTIKSGSLIIAMDNDKQNIGSLFNIAAYGLVVDLLNNNIPVKWAITKGKLKDGNDFTANVARFAPSAQAQTTLSFSGGPFIVEESYANLARARISAFARNVAVYELKQDTPIEIRYELLFKPRPFVNSTNSNIITGLFDNAGIATYKVGPDFSVENSSCFTIIMEPHNDVNTGTPTIRSFLESGGNFYAQCLSTQTFENAPSGFFLSTAGTTGGNVNTVPTYPNPDLSFSQFVGAVDPSPGGSVEDWFLTAGSIFRSNTSSHAESGSGSTQRYNAMQGKVLSASSVGGVVFYVGGHNYNGTALETINGQRLMFNALLTPARRPSVCNIQPLEIPVSDLTLSKSHANPYLIGTQDSYSFTVTNIGTAASVDDYTVTDTLPAGLTFVGGSGSGWTFSSSVLGNGRTRVTAVNSTSLAVNATSSFTLTFGITAGAVGTRTNNAYVSGGGEVVTTNDAATVTNTVIGLSGRVFEDLNTVGVEDPTDPGLSGLTVTVVDNAITYTATTDANGNWSIAGTTPSTTATVTIGTSGGNSILSGATQSFGADPSNHATGTSGTADGGKDGFRNILTNISVTKTGPATALVSDTIAYVITTSNAGPNPATSVVVTDTLPAGATYVSSSRSGTLSGSVVTWPAMTVNVGSPVIDTVRVAAPSSVATLLNIAAGTTVRLDTNPANNNGSASGARVTTQLTIPDLTITKSHNGFFTVGADSAYTITIKNIGTGSSLTSTVTDTLPAGLTYQSATGVRGTWTFGTNGQVLTATLTGSLLAADSASFKVTVRPGAAAQPSLTNTARVVGARETALGNNSASDPTIVNVPDITVIKTAQTFTQNTNGTYTVKIKNVGTGPSTGTITVVDTLAATLTYVSAANVIGTWAFAQNGQVTTATYAASLAPTDSAVFSIMINPTVAAVPSVSNTARVSGGSELNLANNTSTISTTVTPATDLTLSKSALPNPFIYGSNGTYTITVNNIGGQVSSGNIIVTDTLPVGLNFVSGSGTGWGFTSASSGGRSIVTATYTGAALAAISGTTNFTLTVSVLSTAANVTNTGWVSGGGDAFAANNSGSNTNPITGKPDLQIVKTSPANFTQGTASTYTITVTNIGTVSTSGASTVVDTIPAAFTVGSVANQNGWTLSKVGNVVTATSNTVFASNASTSFTIPVTPLAAAVPSVTNKAVVSNASQVNLANDTSYVTTPVTGLTDIIVAKTSSAFSEGAPGTYTITLKNIGTAPSSGAITMLDTLAAGITFVSSSSSPAAGWTIGAVGQVVTATSSNVMAVNDSVVFTVNVNVGTVGASVTNRARISGGNDSNSGNNLATLVTTVGTKPDLTLTKTSSTFAVGLTNATYSFVVTNSGSAATTGSISVVDTLPAGVTFVSVTGGSWTGSAVGQVVTATNSAITLNANGGNNTQLKITVSIGVAAYPSVTNRAYVSGGGEVVTSNDMGSVTTSVTGPDLTIAKTSLASFSTGSALSKAYSFTVTNSGNGSIAIGTYPITITDTLPVGVTAVTQNGSNDWSITYNTTTRVLVAVNSANHTYNAGQSAQVLDLNVTFGSSTPASVTNTAYVSSPADVNTANNTSSVTTPVSGVIDLALIKTSTALFTPGTTGTYTLKVKNIGSAATSGSYTVTDTLPEGLTLGSGSSTVNGWTITITNPSTRAIVSASRSTVIAANDSASFSVSPTVTTAAMPSVYNKGYVSGGNQQASPANDTASVVTPVATPDLTITKTATTASFNAATGTYRITVKNTGTYLAASPITVRDTIPTGLSSPVAAATGPNSAGWGAFAITGSSVVGTYNNALAAGDSASFTITANVDVGAPSSVKNRARVSFTGTELSTTNNIDSVTVTVGAQVDLQITKATSTTNFTYGTAGTYNITVQNIGSLASSGQITVVDTLASGLTYPDGSTTSNGWTIVATTVSGNKIITATNPGPIAASASSQFSISPTVNVAGTSVANTARVSGGGDVNTSNNTSSITTPIVAPNLIVAKAATSTFVQGSNATYRLTVKNIGTAATNATFTVVDTLRAGLAYVSGSGTGWTFVPTTGANGRPIITATYSNSPPVSVADSAFFALTVAVTDSAYPTVQNSAVVAGGGEYATTDNTVSITTSVGGQPDLTLAKARTGTFQRGSQATYTLTVTNIGTVATTDSIIVTDTLRAGLSYVSLSGTGWTGSATSGVVTAVYKGAALAATNGAASFTLTVLINVNAPDSVVNDAWIAGGGEFNTSNDKSNKVVAQLGGVPSVTLLKSIVGGGTTTLPNAVLTYSIAFTNGGNASAFSVVVTDSLPAQVDFKVGSVTTSYPGVITGVTEYNNGTVWTYVPVSGGCSAPPGYDRCVRKIRWTLNSSVPPAASGSVTFQVRVK